MATHIEFVAGAVRWQVMLWASRHTVLETTPAAPSARMNALAKGEAARWFR